MPLVATPCGTHFLMDQLILPLPSNKNGGFSLVGAISYRHAYQFHFWVRYMIFQSSYSWTLNYQHISCLKPPISWPRGIPFLLARQCRGLGNAKCLVGLRLLNLRRFNIMDFLKRCPSDKYTFTRLWKKGWHGEALGFTSSAQKNRTKWFPVLGGDVPSSNNHLMWAKPWSWWGLYSTQLQRDKKLAMK